MDARGDWGQQYNNNDNELKPKALIIVGIILALAVLIIKYFFH